MTMSTEDPHLSQLGMDSKENLRSNSILRLWRTRVQLRHLQHKGGHIREYIKEFQELLLDIKSMGSKMPCFTSSMVYVDGPRWSLRGVGCKASPL